MKRLVARFYISDAGIEPVRDWLGGMDAGDRLVVAQDLASLELGWPLDVAAREAVSDDVFVVRSWIAEDSIETRTYFAVQSGEMLLLVGVAGRGNERDEISLAQQRLHDHRTRC